MINEFRKNRKVRRFLEQLQQVRTGNNVTDHGRDEDDEDSFLEQSACFS